MDKQVQDLQLLIQLKEAFKDPKFKQSLYKDLYFNLLKKHEQLEEELKNNGTFEEVGDLESQHN